MSIIETKVDVAIKELGEWAAWERINANKNMGYPQPLKYSASESAHSLNISPDRACYVEAVVIGAEEDVDKKDYKIALENFVDGKTTREIAEKDGRCIGTISRTIERTINCIAMALVQSDKYNKDAPKSNFIYF